MKHLYLALLVLVVPLVCACSVTRSDFLLTASGTPDIIIRQGNEDLSVTAGFFDFGETEVYDPVEMSFTIENRGILTLHLRDISFDIGESRDFILDVSETDSLVRPGESTDFTIVFTPTEADTIAMDVGITSNDPDNPLYTITLKGTGISKGIIPPSIRVKQGTHEIPKDSVFDFGSVTEGSRNTVRFTIGNEDDAEADLSIFSVIPTGQDSTVFEVNGPEDGTLSPGEDGTFTVTFTPQSDKLYTAVIRIMNNDPDSEEGAYTFTVTGEGTDDLEPDISVWKSGIEITNADGFYDFGTVERFPVKPASFGITLENNGTDTLNIFNIILNETHSNGEFGVHRTPVMVAPGGSETFNVTFSPDNDLGLRKALISITSDDPDEGSYVFEVRGTSVEEPVPDIEVVSASTGESIAPGSEAYSFLDTEVGDTRITSITVSNLGTSALNIDSVDILSGGEHYWVDGFPTDPILPGDASRSFDVAFTPKKSVKLTAVVEIRSDDRDEDPFTFTITGRGVEKLDDGIPLLYINGRAFRPYSVFDFGKVPKGDSVFVTLTVKNEGRDGLELCPPLLLGVPGQYDTDMRDEEVEIEPGEGFSFHVIFSPTRSGVLTANLFLKGDFTGNYRITLTGTGG